MSNLKYSLVTFDDTATITVFHNGEAHVATDAHPNWAGILEGVTINDDVKALDLFDVTKTVARKFERLGTRVTAKDNRLFYDGDEVNDSLARKILGFIEAGVEDWEPLVKFMEKVYANPNEHSRSQLFEWLERHDYAINDEGEILGYKAVYTNKGDDAVHAYRSITSGTNTVIVDDVEYAGGQVPQSVGSIVQMARGEVVFNPALGCEMGLHVSNFRYANAFGQDYARAAEWALLLIAVDPVDVVSVPTESNAEKFRVSRYRVVREERVEDARVESVSPVFHEVKPLGDGDKARVIAEEWYGSAGDLNTDLAEYGLSKGETVTVTDRSSLNPEKNFYVIMENGAGVYVAKSALERVVEEKDEDPDWSYGSADDVDSWDSWEDDEDSWGF